MSGQKGGVLGFLFFFGLFLLFNSCATAPATDTKAGGSGGSGGGGGLQPGHALITGTIAGSGANLENADVYVVNQEGVKAHTDASGNFSLDIDLKADLKLKLKGPQRASTNAQGVDIVIVTANGLHGIKQDNIAVSDGQTSALNTVTVKPTGTITGKVYKNPPDGSYLIDVGIPGTSILGTAPAGGGTFTLTGVPEGNYDFLRAESIGYNYGMFSGVNVTANTTTDVGSMTLLISAGPSGNFVINDDESVTPYKALNLTIAASSNAILMMVADNSSMLGGQWKPLQTEYVYSNTNTGNVTVYVKFTDVNGLETSPVSDSVTVNLNPLVSMSSPSGYITSTQPTFTWSVSPLTNSTYNFQLATDSGFSSIVDSTNACPTNLFTLSSTSLSDGTAYYYRAAIKDKFGTNWSWSSYQTVTIDRSGPTATITTPANGAVIPGSALQVYYNTSDAGVGGTTTYIKLNSGSFNAQGSGAPVMGLANGSNTLFAYAVDSLGNVGPTNYVGFTADTSGIIYVSPTGNDSNPGVKVSPVLTINQAISLASTYGLSNIYVQAGTYITNAGLASSGSGVTASLTGLNIQGGWNAGYTAQTGYSTLDGEGCLEHIVYISANSTKLSRLCIINGNTTGPVSNPDTGNSGPGICINSSYNTISNCILTNHNATGDGAIFMYNGGNNTVVDCIINQNNASYRGAGISLWFSSYNNILNSTLSNNNVVNNGGAIYMNASSYNVVSNVKLLFNYATNAANSHSAGLGVNSGSYIDVLDSLIVGNRNNSTRGSAFNFMAVGNLRIVNNVMSNNINVSGMSSLIALYSSSATTFTNLVISNNLFSSTNMGSDYGIYEYGTAGIGKKALKLNTFMTNEIRYLYYIGYNTRYVTNNTLWTNINLPSYVGTTADSTNNVVLP